MNSAFFVIMRVVIWGVILMHKFFLRQALKEAMRARGFCAPNPSVGAVAVKNGEVIAKAYHQGPGTAHAERALLEKLSPNLSDVTLYVTLEPCNHWGKTPPCVDIILERGIKQVIYGYQDPNPIVKANNTSARLNDKGVSVLHHPIPEITAFYQSYEHWTKTNMPWVTAKIAQSLDGKIAMEGGRPVQLSNEACAAFTHQQRKNTDIILTTAKTIMADDPQMTARLIKKSFAKPLAVIDPHLSLNYHEKCFQLPRDVHVFYHQDLTPPAMTKSIMFHGVGRAANASHELMLGQGPAYVLDGLALQAVLRQLGKLGYHDVWVEAGGKLFSALHEAKLVNRTYVYLAPTLMGDKAIPAFHSSELFSRPHDITMTLKNNNLISCFDWHDL